MPLPDLDPVLMQRLVNSTPWRAYAEWLLAHLGEISAQLDHAKDDHRFIQGYKYALKLALEQPYTVGLMPSPLTMPGTVARVRAPKPPADDPTLPPVRQFHRPSHLA
jgi:hypothetical protein